MQGKHKCQIITAIFIAALSVLFVGKAQALEYQNSVDVQFTFNPYISLTVSGDLVINDLAPGNSADSNIITVTASSNSPAGYALYSSVGSSTYNYTDLRLSGSNTTNVFTNLSSNVVSLSNFSDNTWGYSYSTDSGTTWQSGDVDAANAPISGYNGLPLYNAITYTDPETSETINTGIKLANAEKNATTNVQFKIGAKASSTQATGTYTNVVNFINVAKVITTNYTLSYVDNSGEATNMPATATGTTTSGAVTLPTNVPTRNNYIFKGWCDVDNTSDQSTCSDGTNTGTTTQPGGVYALNTTNNSATVNMYAVWESTIPVTTIADGGDMQNISSKTDGGCPDTLTVGQVYTLTDSRDSTSYRVAKLADGNCWMLDNLALDIASASVQANLNENTTNASNTTLGYLKNGGGTTNDQYPTAAVGYADSSNYYSVPKVAITGTCQDAYCVNSAGAGSTWSSTDVTSATINGVTSIAQGKIGAYYNYCAASAGSYCYGNGTSDTGSPTSDPDASTIQDVKEDICPKGWRMPTGSSAGEYQALYTAYSSDVANFQTALSTPLSGVFSFGTARNQGYYGYFWSSTWNVSSLPWGMVNNMYYLSVYSDVGPALTSIRYYGYSVRCLLSV